MKARIEAGNLRYVRKTLEHRFDRGQIVWLMEWSQRSQPLQVRHHGRRDPRRSTVLRAAVHHPVPNAEHAASPVHRSQPFCHRAQGAGLVPHLGPQRSIHHYAAFVIADGKVWRSPDAFNLAP
jgi:hypothetical protein